MRLGAAKTARASTKPPDEKDLTLIPPAKGGVYVAHAVSDLCLIPAPAPGANGERRGLLV